MTSTPLTRLPLASNAGSPAPGWLLSSSSRKSRLPSSQHRCRRCRCCCGWCSELRGSESRLRPFPAATMKWMFKEDHSLGKRSATGLAVGVGAAGGPLPHSGRPGLGPAGRMPLFGLWLLKPRSLGQLPADPVPPSTVLGRSQGTEDRGHQDARTRALGVRRSQGEVGWGPGKRPRAGVTVSRVCFCHRTQMRGICEDPSEIPRPGSGKWIPRPFTSLSPCRLGPVIEPQAIQQLTT